jgi:hypothetical protein
VRELQAMSSGLVTRAPGTLEVRVSVQRPARSRSMTATVVPPPVMPVPIASQTKLSEHETSESALTVTPWARITGRLVSQWPSLARTAIARVICPWELVALAIVPRPTATQSLAAEHETLSNDAGLSAPNSPDATIDQLLPFQASTRPVR